MITELQGVLFPVAEIADPVSGCQCLVPQELQSGVEPFEESPVPAAGKDLRQVTHAKFFIKRDIVAPRDIEPEDFFRVFLHLDLEVPSPLPTTC